MNMTGMNPPATAGGPVGGGMMMNNGSPAMQVNTSPSPDQVKAQLNTYIYEYFLKLGLYDHARRLVNEDKFEIRTKPAVKQSPGRRKDGEVNGVDADAMDTDIRDDIPDDLPRPMHAAENTPGIGFLFEWFSIFSDLFTAHQRSSKMQGGQTVNMGPAAQYLLQHQNMQRMRESQQSQNLARPNVMQQNYAVRNIRNNIMNGNMPREMANKMPSTPQQLQQMNKAAMSQQQQQQQQMQRDQGDVDMNGRPSSPVEGENGGSPSKRPRLEGQHFNGGMMPNVRPGMPNVGPQNMMIQNAFNPNMNNAQFRPNGAMPQKPMQPGMANGMINMGNAGSPMMQGMTPAQFTENMQMEMYNPRIGGQQMQGTPGGGQSGNHALQDYQMQLMLLEQQNKKRLMMARQEQDNAVNRDGAPMVGMQPGGMSPNGSRTGTSPIPGDQMKRTPQLGGLPGSPSAAEAMAGRSPAGMNFMNGMPTGDFNPAMFMKDNQGMMMPGGPNMRPPTSMDMQQAMARQQQAQRMAGQFPGGQPMVQQPSQGQPAPMGTPGQRNEMPPPQAPPVNSAQRNQPGSPQSSNAPPTPSTANKPNPKSKKGKEDSNKKKTTKKNSAANAASSENEPPATPTPSTPITPVHPQGFNGPAGKPGAPGMPNANQGPPPAQPMPPNQPMHQPDLQASFTDNFGPDQNFNLDFSTLENSDVLENFDFDSFLNTTNDDTFNFDGAIGVGGDFGLDPSE
ncbi:hypothetical protein LTR99_007833 [Exophiala xenobiotica]|nr:hypothetical protein LTR41_004942 [Exophiala xenobiotica]KAK5534792.1 hypothetical protein LTR23_008723 [Chaetothyriales sp. CCFEE 6169]KAK5223810.1 hypothetical protein LTR72_005196 [Exophiala xenobiotica]KAK5273597.1 hypothetical protein LTR96_000197 [Exophiala xenobiotica]KAK5289211.1 hypothetical protein LTR14_007462 [Exophiala xenobiotica]